MLRQLVLDRATRIGPETTVSQVRVSPKIPSQRLLLALQFLAVRLSSLGLD
jgi:hypothetical protein